MAKAGGDENISSGNKVTIATDQNVLHDIDQSKPVSPAASKGVGKGGAAVMMPAVD